LLRHAAGSRQTKQARRLDATALAVDASVAVGKQELAIGIEKIGRPQRAQISRKLRDHGPSLLDRGWR